MGSVLLSLSDWPHLVEAYGNCSKLEPANPKIQLIEHGLHRPQHAVRAGLRLRPARVEESDWKRHHPPVAIEFQVPFQVLF